MVHGMEFEVEDLEDRRRRQNESRCRLTAEQKDERRQDNDDKKRLARHHPSDLLRSPTRERIGGGQHGVVSPALRASPHWKKSGISCSYFNAGFLQDTCIPTVLHYSSPSTILDQT